ncbi:MAG TPA: hypothetical protein VFV55_11010 [Usitatibacteraceae bacterium]|nr:hypothetical protein [Usitatibacteraceae bacterium]
MLLPWRDELHIAIRPTELVRVRRTFGARGVRAEHATSPVEPAADNRAWRSAIDVLAQGVAQLAERPASVRIVLSNHFVRYAIAPWRDDMRSPAEREGFIRHCFRENYGDAAEGWVIRENPEPYGRASLACAVDRELVDAVRDVFRGTRLSLAAIQPLFMAAFNKYRKALGSTGCFLVYEKGRLCGATYADGEWRSALAVRVEEGCFNAATIERELLLQGVPEDFPVFLCQVDDASDPGTFARPVKRLDPPGLDEPDFTAALLGGGE